MNRLTLMAAMMLLTIVACKKKDTPTEEPEKKFTYTLNGLRDILLEDNISSTSLLLDVEPLEGERKKVAIGIQGLPPKVDYKISITEGVPPFNTIISFQGNGGEVGSFPFTISTKAENEEAKFYQTKLIVGELSQQHCNKSFYNARPHMYSIKSMIPYSEYTVKHRFDSVTRQCFITHITIRSAGLSYEAYTDSIGIPLLVDCTNKTLTIKEQEIKTFYTETGNDAYIISGSGKIAQDAKTFYIDCKLDAVGATTKYDYKITGEFLN